MSTDAVLNHIRNELLDIRFIHVNELLSPGNTDSWGNPQTVPTRYTFSGGALNGEIFIDAEKPQLALHWRAPWDAGLQGEDLFPYTPNNQHSASDAVFKLKRRLLELSLY